MPSVTAHRKFSEDKRLNDDNLCTNLQCIQVVEINVFIFFLSIVINFATTRLQSMFIPKKHR